MPPDDWFTERAPLGVDINGNGPVPDDEASFFICFGCNQPFPCDLTEHDRIIGEVYG